MQWLMNFLNWLGETPLATGIAESTWLFPAIEVVHVFAISLVFGTIAIIDLRLLGLASANHRYTQLAHELLPWTWGAWVVAAMFGTLLLATRPIAYFENTDLSPEVSVHGVGGRQHADFPVCHLDCCRTSALRPLPSRIGGSTQRS